MSQPPTLRPALSAPSPERYAAFLAAFPDYARTDLLDRWRTTEFARLDETGHVYLDFTGGGLYGQSQLDRHFALLREGVFGNPHSSNPTSLAMTRLVDRARRRVLEYFSASADDYVVIFTPNASGALKLVGEAYPFAPGGAFALLADDHNSVNGIREFARARGAAIHYVPLVAPDLRLDAERLAAVLASAQSGADNLFAFPAQSNYSGVQHPLSLVEQARTAGWDILLDAAAFAPTNRLDLGRLQPDFVSLSFYKMFGYPTGVGALLARREALARLRRPWFAGGTIRIVSVRADGHFMGDGEAAYEDGTVNYLNIPAIEFGLDFLEAAGIDRIHERVRCLTGWLLGELLRLRHSNGRPLVRLHGPETTRDRGGTLSMSYFDPAGQPIRGQLIERLAMSQRISLRTGCFCNPGAGESAFRLSADVLQAFYTRERGPHFDEFAAEIAKGLGVDVSAVRISVGLASNFADVERFLSFAGSLLDRQSATLQQEASTATSPPPRRDAA